jgi:hypothetical protein
LVTISAQPSSTSVTQGNSATFTVTAAATLPTATIAYQWQVSTDAGTTWSNVSGATSSSLTLSSVQSGSNGYRYRCRLSASLSLIYTASATLTVLTGGKLTIARANGTSTFTGSGTSADPYVRAATVNGQSSDALCTVAGLGTGAGANYTFTATASGTATVAVNFNDVDDNANYAGVYKTNAVQGGTFSSNTNQQFTRTFSIAAGDVIAFRIENILSTFSNVSVSAT